ncbi:MAG: hypothetical protein ACRERD_09840 [Candidatus Binatia bacterium]
MSEETDQDEVAHPHAPHASSHDTERRVARRAAWGKWAEKQLAQNSVPRGRRNDIANTSWQ